jgi:hypothetical protein
LHISHSAHKLISNLRSRPCSNHCRLVVTVQFLPGSRRLLYIISCFNLAFKWLAQLWNGAWKLGDCCDSLVRFENYAIIILIFIQQDALLNSLLYQVAVAVTVWQIPDAVDTVVCAPDDGWWYHPKHVEQFPDKINCVTLHLVGHILKYS